MTSAADKQASLPINATADAVGPKRQTLNVIGTPIDVISAAAAVQRIAGWAARRESRYVCICNTHSVVTASRNQHFMQVLTGADMATPDGAPVAWLLRRSGASGQQRVSGPDLMLDFCAAAAADQTGIYLYGGTDDILQKLRARLLTQWPHLRIVGMHSPPFRALTADEDRAVVTAINASGAGSVWVSLGCPKQEQWMAAHRGRVHAVMVGVGAAFDFHAGTITRAPLWMRNNGLEWLHRFASEPRRLWKRYLVTNTLFILAATRQLLQRRFGT